MHLNCGKYEQLQSPIHLILKTNVFATMQYFSNYKYSQQTVSLGDLRHNGPKHLRANL